MPEPLPATPGGHEPARCRAPGGAGSGPAPSMPDSCGLQRQVGSRSEHSGRSDASGAASAVGTSRSSGRARPRAELRAVIPAAPAKSRSRLRPAARLARTNMRRKDSWWCAATSRSSQPSRVGRTRTARRSKCASGTLPAICRPAPKAHYDRIRRNCPRLESLTSTLAAVGAWTPRDQGPRFGPAPHLAPMWVLRPISALLRYPPHGMVTAPEPRAAGSGRVPLSP